MTSSTLRPQRVEDARAWTRQVFAAGDYAGAAMFGDATTFEFHAARALLRGDRASAAALADFDQPEARFHAAAAEWIHGDAGLARRLLVGLDLPHARSLARLLDQPRIRVLAQLPWLPGAMTDLLGGARHDSRFQVRHIGHHTGDRQNVPYADVRGFVDDGFAPDFYVAAMAEWHHVPPSLQQLACPLFGHVADHDLHIQTIRPWLDLFDELCVTDRTEWLDVQGLTRGAVSSFPKVFALPAQLPPLSTDQRHLDFFVSGTMLDPYHPDKAKVLHELLAMPDIALRVVRGFTGPLAFHALLAASKASFTFVRRPGAMPTRGLESLALGCAVALQEQSILNLWVGPNEGIYPYGSERGQLASAVRGIVDHWDHFEPAARRGAQLVRREFAMTKVASQYLRFLTFRAAAPRNERRVVDSKRWCQKRLCVSRTWLPDNPSVRRRSMQANFRHLSMDLRQRPSATAIVDMARELLCEFAYYEKNGKAEAAEFALRDDAMRLLEKCVRLFPKHLVGRFLLVRTQWHHGDAKARLQALQLAHDTIAQDASVWQVGPDDDVMPFDFHAEYFNYRDYLDLVAKAVKGATVPSLAFTKLILAALAGYVARKTGKPALHEMATSWDPGFARYRLDLAKALLRRADGADRERAIGLLQELADGSGEFPAAAPLLQRELARTPTAGTVPAVAARAVARVEADTIDASLCVSSLFAVERREAKIAGDIKFTTAEQSNRRRLAVLVPRTALAREVAEVVAELATQTCASKLDVVVALALDAAGFVPTGLPEGMRVQTTSVAGAASWSERLNACVQAATAPLLTIAMPGDRWRPDALELLQDALTKHPRAGLAFANEGWTAGEVARFEPSTCCAFACPPPFAHRRLHTSNAIGLHAMWRRSLHDQHGLFDAQFGAAAEYEFWLRLGDEIEARQLTTLLATSSLRATWRALRDPTVDLTNVERARAVHRRGAEASPFQPQALWPSTLCAPGISEEAASHARLGVITDEQRRDLASLEQFLGTALLHGDTATALCLLRAAAASSPRLIAPRLAEAELLTALGAPGARDALVAASQCQPYEDLVAQRLAMVPPPAVSDAETPNRGATERELMPCRA